MQNQAFREKLDAIHQWPSLYMFKFIVPLNKVAEVQAVFPQHEASQQPSSKGNYISLTFKMMALSAEDIIEKYEQTSKIEGIISL